MHRPTLGLGLVLALTSCGEPIPFPGQTRGSLDAASLHLASLFDEDAVTGELPAVVDLPIIDWRFDRPWEPPESPESEADGPNDSTAGEAEDTAPNDAEAAPVDGDREKGEEPEDDPKSAPGELVHGAEAFIDVTELAVVDGLLTGRTGARPTLLLERRLVGSDRMHAIELRLRASAGESVGVLVGDDEEVDRKLMRSYLEELDNWPDHAPLTPGPDLQTVVVPLQSGFGPSKVGDVRRIVVQPTDASDATFAIESIRIVTEREHLSTQPAGFDWRGLGEVYRQTLMVHTTETVELDVGLPADPWLDLAVGTLAGYPTTFQVHACPIHGEPVRVLRRTVTRQDRWEEVPIDLSRWAGREVGLRFSVASDRPEQVGFFGTAVVRNRHARPQVDDRPIQDGPQGVILLLADTLRRDHLQAYGYERPTAPSLAQLAAEGVLFEDVISQGSWTKVSVPSILTSLYPTCSGVKDMTGRVPDEATTLAEAFQAAGFATMATSSVPFSGKVSNLQQGIDVLHESASVEDLGHDKSKNARTFVDRVADWLETHRDQPFFIFLHVFDPHSPFTPYDPYDGMFSESDSREEHREVVERIQEHWKDSDEYVGDLPERRHMDAAEISDEEVAAFVTREKAWYDESIRAMDAEVSRLMERLEDLGLHDRTLLAFTSDHGEEFLEHGRHFHGQTLYGEMTNVPLLFWGPSWVPPGRTVTNTIQCLDVFPTLLDLAGLPAPATTQGRSLVSHWSDPDPIEARPAFAEHYFMGFEDPGDDEVEALAMVAYGFRLVHNTTRPEERPEYELYDHTNDPLNQHDLATERPEVVRKMAHELELWHKWAKAHRLGGGEEEELTETELAELRSLGYVR